ncbi:hypothetical protein AAG906_016893 [Vitis piasezkii]
MKLNPAKCAFDASVGNFLRFMELQCLTSRLTALGLFIVRFTNKLRSFFLTLKGVSMFSWTDECKLVYYVRKAMVDVETWYSQVEQTALSLKNVARKLRSYFQAHQLTVLTNQSLQVTLHKLDLSRRMLKWAIELSEYGIKY